MPISATVTPGITFQEGIKYTFADFNAGFRPQVTLDGSLTGDELEDHTITFEHLQVDAFYSTPDIGTVENAYVLDYGDGNPSALKDGLIVSMVVGDGRTNTGPSTLKVGALGTRPITIGGQELRSGDLAAGRNADFRFSFALNVQEPQADGGAWELISNPAQRARDTEYVGAGLYSDGISGLLPGAVAGPDDEIFLSTGEWIGLDARIDSRTTDNITAALANQLPALRTFQALYAAQLH